MLCMEELRESANGGIGKRLCNKPSGHDGDHDFVFGPNCPCGHSWHQEDCATCGCPPIRDVPGEPRGAGFRRLEALSERRRSFVRGAISQVAQKMAGVEEVEGEGSLRGYPASARERMLANELAAALRKVTANLRGRVERGLERFTQASVDIDLADEGVLEAEALLKRIDEGGNDGA